MEQYIWDACRENQIKNQKDAEIVFEIIRNADLSEFIPALRTLAIKPDEPKVWGWEKSNRDVIARFHSIYECVIRLLESYDKFQQELQKQKS